MVVPMPVVVVPVAVFVVVAVAVLVVVVALAADARVMAAMPDRSTWLGGVFQRITRLGKSDWVLIPALVIMALIAFGDWARLHRRSAAVWAEIAAFATFLL